MAAESWCVRPSAAGSSAAPFNYIWPPQMESFSKNKFYKELGMFSLRKRIEDSILRAEMLAPTALEHEEARHVKQENIIRDHDLWDDPGKSNEILIQLADSAKVVDALKDLKYKAEEAKLITELAEMDTVNYELFKQAYYASLDVNKFLDKYEMSKFLKEPCDLEGACLIVESRLWRHLFRGQLTRMYMKWAEKQGHAVRIVERCSAKNGGIKSATIEFEFKFAYGYLSGERGVHRMIGSRQSESIYLEASLAAVDVIPLFLESSPELLIDDKDLLVSCPSSSEKPRKISSSVHIQHVPTGVVVQSKGERSRVANKIKALNRLKAKLLVILRDQGISDVRNIKKDAIVEMWSHEARRYVFQPTKMVVDVKTVFGWFLLNDYCRGAALEKQGHAFPAFSFSSSDYAVTGRAKDEKLVGQKLEPDLQSFQNTRDFKSRFRPNRSSSGKSETISGFTATRRTKPTGACGAWRLRRRRVRRVEIRLADSSSGAWEARGGGLLRAWFAAKYSSL
ncbi:Peptide chain release factor PrfB3 [Abeliophyllum distichum]|uniref:Peptide chain release factor PrfB3 n=1 Tax=Abeliophyllum distichum TaxID=126358 RepID=A0ABD1VCF1_9LAMI